MYHSLEAPSPAIALVDRQPPPSEQARTEQGQHQSALVEFDEWSDKFLTATDPSIRATLEPGGVALAAQRRDAMAQLIESDPKQALERAVPYGVRQRLPASIRHSLEEPISGRGKFAVLGVLPEPGQAFDGPGIQRTADIGGKIYRAFVYGRRLAQTTKSDIPLHGIAIDDAAAFHEDPVRVLDPEEADSVRSAGDAAQSHTCPVSGQPSTEQDDETVVNVGGKHVFLCSGGHIQQLNAELIAAESGLGDPGSSSVAASAWTQGNKTLLYIRVRFSDQPSEPQSLSSAESMMASVNSFFVENSYQTTSITTTFTPVYVLPKTMAEYTALGIYTFRSDALAAAAAGGYDYLNYNLDAVRYDGGPGGFAGAAFVGSRGCWMKSSSAGVAAHEFGHNYGLWHANWWNASNDSILGPGTWVEYGDDFDTMGAAAAGANHFNARYKEVLEWLTPSDLQIVTASGTYQVYAHDTIASTNRIRALKIAKDAALNYWVEFRQKFPANPWMTGGAGLRRAGLVNTSTGSELLDTTPGTPDGKADSPILIGRTFSDSAADIHITPISKAATTPESLNVVVHIGPFPANRSPTLTVNTGSTVASIGSTLTFTANATDADGDALAYSWDFGDRTFGPNSSAASNSWGSSGEYVVRCTVTDMKGGTAIDSVIVSIGTVSTYRISGQVMSAGGSLQGVRVHNGQFGSAYRAAYTESDGTYNLVGLVAGAHTITAVKYQYSMDPATSTVLLGPNAAGVDFSATSTSSNNPPGIAIGATVSPSPVTGTTASLNVLGTDNAGEPSLTYTWTAGGPAPVIFSVNGNNGAKYTTATFAQAGNYTLQAIITDPGDLSVTSSVGVTVRQTLTSIVMTPANASVLIGGTRQFKANRKDQFRRTMLAPMTWNVTGGGTIVTGLFTATTLGGPFTVTASNGGITGTARVTVGDNAAPSVNAGLDQTISILDAASLHGVATDDGKPNDTLTTAWSKVSGPGKVAFDDAATSDTSASFTRAGDYVLRLTASDGALSRSDTASVIVSPPDPAAVVVAVNAGGPQYVDGQGIVYEADRWFSGGVISNSAPFINATDDVPLYQTERAGNFSYAIPVASGTHDYNVTLKFAETGGALPGERIFDVLLEGALTIHSLDLAAEAGPDRAWDMVLPVTVTDGVLDIEFRTASNSQKSATVSALAVSTHSAVPPAKPTNLMATPVSSTRIDLHWTQSASPDVTRNRIFRSTTSGGPYTRIANINPSRSYSDGNVTAGVRYYYLVRAVRDGVPSEPSNEASAVPQ